MKRFAIAFLLSAPMVAHSAEVYCDTARPHSIDVELAESLEAGGGVTSEMRDAQGRAHEQWDAELNRVYTSLAASLEPAERTSLRDAQRAWLAFREAETTFWWSPSISDEGTMAPVVVSGRAIEMLRARTCELSRYQALATGESGSVSQEQNTAANGPALARVASNAPQPTTKSLAASYGSALNAHVNARWNSSKAPQSVKCQVLITQIPGGEVLDVAFESCPFDGALRETVERAVRRDKLPYAGYETVFARRVRVTFCTPQELC